MFWGKGKCCFKKIHIFASSFLIHPLFRLLERSFLNMNLMISHYCLKSLTNSFWMKVHAFHIMNKTFCDLALAFPLASLQPPLSHIINHLHHQELQMFSPVSALHMPYLEYTTFYLPPSLTLWGLVGKSVIPLFFLITMMIKTTRRRIMFIECRVLSHLTFIPAL